MVISIAQEWRLPEDSETFTKLNPKNAMFYVVYLRKGRQRYIKVGHTTRTIKARFSDSDYTGKKNKTDDTKKQSTDKADDTKNKHKVDGYDQIRLLYVAEIASDKSATTAGNQVETLTRCAWCELSGLTFVPNDRFQFFRLPDVLPVYTQLLDKPCYFYIPTR